MDVATGIYNNFLKIKDLQVLAKATLVGTACA